MRPTSPSPSKELIALKSYSPYHTSSNHYPKLCLRHHVELLITEPKAFLLVDREAAIRSVTAGRPLQRGSEATRIPPVHHYLLRRSTGGHRLFLSRSSSRTRELVGQGASSGSGPRHPSQQLVFASCCGPSRCGCWSIPSSSAPQLVMSRLWYQIACASHESLMIQVTVSLMYLPGTSAAVGWPVSGEACMPPSSQGAAMARQRMIWLVKESYWHGQAAAT